MKRQFLFALLFAATISLTVQSQDKATKAKPDEKKPADMKPAKPTPFDKVEGYKVHMIAGFTVIVHKDVLNAETKDLKKLPLECLELELKNVVALMNQKAADALRKVPIWAEWEEQTAMANGRTGRAYAVYYGGNQLSMLGSGREPLKAKCVTMLLTKTLTKNYQDKDRPETLVMLHELAHAVHDQMLGTDNPAVITAYQQAMARKLYDKSLYIATNQNEFFAEASCAFLDRLDYFPKNRDELKSHDAETYKLMEGVWGKAASAAALSAKSKRPANGSDEFNMEIALSGVKWKKALLGNALDIPSLKGRIVVLGYVAPSQLAIINRLKSWNDDYAPYGLSVTLSYADYNADPVEALSTFKKLNLPFTLHEPIFLPHKEGRTRAEKAGHAIIFDTAGSIVFRGQADDGTIYVKEAVGKRLLETSGISEGNLPKQLQPAVESLKNGDALSAVAAKLQAFTGAGDATIAEPAKKLLGAIVEPGTAALAGAVAMKKSDPLEAFLLAERVSTQFKGLTVANKAATLVQDLRLDKSVQAEMKARKDFEAVEKLETILTAQPGSFEPKSDAFRRKNAGTLKQLQQAVELMKKNHPKAKATEKAEAIAKEYGVD